MKKSKAKPLNASLRKDQKITQQLYIEVHQRGVKQVEFVLLPTIKIKTIHFGSMAGCELLVEFGKVPDSLKLFRCENGIFYALIEPRISGFINAGSEFGTIKDFLSPQGAISTLATIADPYPVRLELGSRGVFQVGEFDILFKVEKPKLKVVDRFVMEGAKASFFSAPFSDTRFEANVVWLALFFAASIFGPATFWLLKAPVERFEKFEDLPDEFLIQFIHPDHFRYLPKIYEDNYDYRKSVQLAMHWVSELQRRWDSEDVSKTYDSDVPILAGFTRLKSSELIEKAWEKDAAGTFKDIEQKRVAAESDRFYKFQNKYPEITLEPSGSHLGSLYLRHLKRIRDLDMAYDSIRLLIANEQKVIAEYYAERGLKREGMFSQPSDDKVKIEKNDAKFLEERDAYGFAEGWARKAESSIFFTEQQRIAADYSKGVQLRPSILWLQKSSLVTPLFVSRMDGRSLAPEEDMIVNAKYSNGLLLIPPLPSPTPTISEKELEFVIVDRREEVRGCYEDSLRRSSTLQGSLKLSWWVDLNGRARDVKVVASTFSSPHLVSCMENLILSWNFPKPRHGAVKVQYPFRFVIEL